jgi:hypothetical protein
MSPIVTATEADLDALAEVVAAAFFDLPPSRWLIRDDTARRQVFPGYFRIYLDYALAAGTITTTPDRDGRPARRASTRPSELLSRR